MIEYWQINLTSWPDGYSCIALQVSKQHYLYLRRNCKHYHADTGDRKIVLLCDFEIEKYQADNIFNHFVTGQFHKEDTGDWD